MKNIKKFLALGLAAVMSLSLAACGTGTGSNATGVGDNASTSGGTRTINIGCWWVQHYDSADTKLEDSVDYTNALPADGDDEETLSQKEINRTIAELKFANVSNIESDYNVKFYWKNLTYTGVQESINNSILAGSPDCDIYMVDPGMGIPAQMNGLALDLKTVLPEDHDLFTNQEIMSYMDMGDGKACIIMRVEAAKQVGDTYPLGFNIQLLEDNGLEDPRDLWERGEWTWDKFVEYMQVLTQDTDGDGQIDQYGYCGYENETLEQLMMSNGANIASGTTETLSSSATGEALQMMYDMYNTYNVCYPYDYEGTPSDSMRQQYRSGKIGFFPIAAWIHTSSNDDYDWDGSGDETLPFDIAYVRWPVGPSGNADTNAGKNTVSGEYYIIPAGVKDPVTVVNILYDLWDWNDGDTPTLRDDKAALNWWYKSTAREEELQTENFNVMFECGGKTTFDLWNSMSIGYDLQSLIKGEVTPAQFQETYKQQVQDGLDAYFK